MKRATWLEVFDADGASGRLSPEARRAFGRLDDALFDLWNLGENVLLAWTHIGSEFRVLYVRHYEIADALAPKRSVAASSTETINDILAGPKRLPIDRFLNAADMVGRTPATMALEVDPESNADLISNLVQRYGVSLVNGRAVVLLDAVEFSLRSPLEQVALLNSLAYSVNSAHRQLLSKDIHINFARTTTGDGFYIWNRSRSVDANIALYQLVMMILADNAVAHRKARTDCVPRLRAAFHVGDHYEFYQVEALNPTTYSYIVGPVTIDLSRMIEKALPGQILVGDFNIQVMDASGMTKAMNTLEFVEKTAASLDHLKGLEISGDCIQSIRCYLTGQNLGGGRYPVNRYWITDKHGANRSVYNAKINIHSERAEPIYLGMQNDNLESFGASRVEVLDTKGPQAPVDCVAKPLP
jgi:hypothetical protein